MRRQIPLAITFIVGTVLIISVFLPPMENLDRTFTLYFDIIAVFAFFLGGGNLMRVHISKLRRRKKDWGFSIVTIAGFLVMLTVGLFKLGQPEGSTIATAVDAHGTWFKALFDHFLIPLQSTMYSLLAFFVASASYRAFRAKNKEATLLLIASFIILLGRTPFGMLITGWIPESFSVLQIPNMAIWIMNSPNLAGQRAIMIGICLGVVSMSLRLILGIERSHLGGDDSG
jgi:peptidoglycan/LPS O-acetylase OafA/YrhL